MNWSPTDLVSVKSMLMKTKKEIFKEWIPFIENLDQRKHKWRNAVKNEKSLYHFLKENIYNND
jgi:hypothetical protein